MTDPRLYAVGAADRSGESWTVALLPAAQALKRLDAERAAHPERVHWIDDPDNPEGGDVEDELRSELEE